MTNPKRRTVTVVMPDDVADWFDAQTEAREMSKGATGLAIFRESMEGPAKPVKPRKPVDPGKPQKPYTRYFSAAEGKCQDCGGGRKYFDHEAKEGEGVWRLCATCGGTGKAV